jgi:hypothetical protein
MRRATAPPGQEVSAAMRSSHGAQCHSLIEGAFPGTFDSARFGDHRCASLRGGTPAHPSRRPSRSEEWKGPLPLSNLPGSTQALLGGIIHGPVSDGGNCCRWRASEILRAQSCGVYRDRMLTSTSTRRGDTDVNRDASTSEFADQSIVVPAFPSSAEGALARSAITARLPPASTKSSAASTLGPMEPAPSPPALSISCAS